MKLMFNKTDLSGKWFYDGEGTEGFTETPPPHTGVAFDENSGGWVEKTVREPAGDEQAQDQEDRPVTAE